MIEGLPNICAVVNNLENLPRPAGRKKEWAADDT